MASAPFLRYAGGMKRIGRKDYWLYLLLFAGLLTVLHLVFGDNGTGTGGLGGGLGTFAVLVVAPRLRDIGRSVWWAAIPFGVAFLLSLLVLIGWLPLDLHPLMLVVEAVSAIWVAILGVIPGQPGRNRYGEPAGLRI